MFLRACKNCGKEMRLPPSRPNQVFCSKECKRVYSNITFRCEQCGKEYVGHRSTEKRTRFCSSECRNIGVGLSNTLESQIVNCKICGSPFSANGRARISRRTCSKECQRVAQAKREEQSPKKVKMKCLGCDKEFLAFLCRAPYRKYCSKPCRAKNAPRNKKKTIITECAYCAAPLQRFRSRIIEYGQQFCDTKCYHAWDKEYKSTPKMLESLTKRLAEGFGKPSKMEDKVADWLTQHNIAFERQVLLKVYVMDFQIGGAYLEVNGCYWHGCPTCEPTLTPRQKRRSDRDRSLSTYCARRNIPLLTIWEHDIKRGDFSALLPLLGDFTISHL
jgi:endogenous inhibitor of DNA gyrase (YacG/DUF329 family)